jgi:hypothetical protein
MSLGAFALARGIEVKEAAAASAAASHGPARTVTA